MRRWRRSLYSEHGALDPSITPEQAVTAAGYLNAFVALLTLVRLGNLPLHPATPVERLVSHVRREHAGPRLGPSATSAAR